MSLKKTAVSPQGNASTVLTTSHEDGPNVSMLPELKVMFPSSPYIPRPGQINAWDSEEFVNAVKATLFLLKNLANMSLLLPMLLVHSINLSVMLLGRDWRHDINGMAALFAKRNPSYAHIMNSFNGAQAAINSTQ
ncbi:hypothetical protein BD408DRAFT_434436 [Parasitella parasitica]|nr:hypothetical protein BD408DRAFT_434436 [Parasitella parasitica]